MENPPRRLGRGWNLPGIPWINCGWNELLVLPSLGSGFHRVNPGIFSILAASLPGYSHFSLEYSFLWPNSLVPAFQILPLRGVFFCWNFFSLWAPQHPKSMEKPGRCFVCLGTPNPSCRALRSRKTARSQRNVPRSAWCHGRERRPRGEPGIAGGTQRGRVRQTGIPGKAFQGQPGRSGRPRSSHPGSLWNLGSTPPAPGSRFRALQGRDDPGRRHPMDLTPVFHEFCHRLGIRFRRGGFFFG